MRHYGSNSGAAYPGKHVAATHTTIGTFGKISVLGAPLYFLSR